MYMFIDILSMTVLSKSLPLIYKHESGQSLPSMADPSLSGEATWQSPWYFYSLIFFLNIDVGHYKNETGYYFTKFVIKNCLKSDKGTNILIIFCM